MGYWPPIRLRNLDGQSVPATAGVSGCCVVDGSMDSGGDAVDCDGSPESSVRLLDAAAPAIGGAPAAAVDGRQRQ